MHRVAATLDAIARTSGKKAKVKALAELLRTLSDEELPVAARLVLGLTLPIGEPRTLGAGWALISSALSEALHVTVARLGVEGRTRGDMGDAVEALMPAIQSTLPVLEVGALFEHLATTADRAQKQRLLTRAFARCAPAEAKYLVKALFGELRIGLQRGLFEEAVAHATDTPLDELRAAAALIADPGALALAARRHELSTATLQPGVVVGFMLASPTESVKEPVDVAHTIVEDKLDGIRAQAHVRGDQVWLFARGQGDVSASFPDVVQSLRQLTTPTILDGEILAVTPDGSPRPFQALQARLGRTNPNAAALRETPVAYVAYDVLLYGDSLISKPWTERRAALERLPVRVNDVTALDLHAPLDAQLDTLFARARARGHEGLMLKRTDAPYDAGARGSAWRKVKRAFATLDCVITRAERGHGKRAGVLSDYTFAVWSGAELVDIGKAYSGLTDAEIAALTIKLEALTTQQLGALHVVRPEVVLEIAFDGLQKSRRHSSGFALRFPRISRIRDDKTAAQADRLETVRALFDEQVQTGHREPEPQLGLFD